MITRFHVENYKALRDVTLDLSQMQLLIGPNDSGKTSILEAMAALCRSVEFDLNHAFLGRWSGVELVSDHATDSTVVLEAAGSNGSAFQYSVAIRFSTSPERQRHAVVEREAVSTGNDVWLSHLRPEILGGATGILQFSRSGTKKLEYFDKIDEQLAREIIRNLSGVQIFRWNARLLSLPCALDSTAGYRLAPSGFGLARVLDAIVGHDRRRFDDLENKFREIFPDVECLRVVPTPGYKDQPTEDELVPLLSRADGKGITVRYVGSDSDVPAAHLSKGMLLILAYLAILYSPEPPRVLLIEEPENGIHPDRLKQVIGILRELIHSQDHVQVVLTSHSPYIVDLFQPEEVTLCRKNAAGEVEVRRLSDSPLVREQLDVFSLGEIWPAEEDRIFEETAPVEAAPAVAEPQP